MHESWIKKSMLQKKMYGMLKCVIIPFRFWPAMSDDAWSATGPRTVVVLPKYVKDKCSLLAWTTVVGCDMKVHRQWRTNGGYIRTFIQQFKGKNALALFVYIQQRNVNGADGNGTDTPHLQYKTITISRIKDKFIHIMHTCSHFLHTIQFVRVQN